MENQTTLEQYGFFSSKNNSFFTAIIPQLRSFNINDSEHKIRAKITEHMRNDIEHYFGDYQNHWGLASLSFEENTAPFNPESYLKDFETGKTDADLLREVLAFSRVYNIILVITNANNDCFVYKPNEKQNTAGVIYIEQNGAEKNYSFNASTEKAELLELINNTQIDGYAKKPAFRL